MKCRKCTRRPSIHMRQHRLALCREHFLEWLPEQTERFIEKYHMFTHEERILVAVSGGKDSLSLWDVLHRLGYTTDGLYINLGISTPDLHYSNRSEEYAQQFAQQRNLNLHIADISSMVGENIVTTAMRTSRGVDRPCSVCGLVKRHVMNQIAREQGYDVLVTGHNLDDEAAVLYNNTLNWQVDLMRRQTPVLRSASGFARKAKPFCRFYERETASYAVLREIEYIEDECPYAFDSSQLKNKELLNRMEEAQPGTKLRFYVGFLNARKSGLFADNDTMEEFTGGEICPICGQPTTRTDKCAFCKLYNIPSPQTGKG
jgi:uncharacterized protein (TIGR00269 family)